MNPELNTKIDALQARVDALTARLDRMEARELEMAATIAEAKPEPEYRYFRNGVTLWKMPTTGNGFSRLRSHTEWTKLPYTMKDLIHSLNVDEITAGEGEPT